MEKIKKYIREIPDFPKPGILFYDLHSLMENPVGFRLALDGLQAKVEKMKATKIVGIESRGFVFGGALADRLELPLITARKPGKLPGKTVSEEYTLEYGTDAIELNADAIGEGDRVVIVDDLIATGGTMAAVARLSEKLGAEVAGVLAVVALTFLPFEAKLADYDVHYLITYDHE